MLLLPPTPLQPLELEGGPSRQARADSQPSAWESSSTLCGCGPPAVGGSELCASQPRPGVHGPGEPVPVAASTHSTTPCQRANPTWNQSEQGQPEEKTMRAKPQTLSSSPSPHCATCRMTSVRSTAGKDNQETAIELPFKGWKLMVP